MNCLDASALVDYLDGVGEIGEFIEDHERAPMFAPTIALHEVFVGGARLRGRDGVREVREDLDWITPLELSVDGAAEAALVEAELRAAGRPIGAMDTLIAGIVRDLGGTLVTNDSHFERVDDLDVHRYR